ncbi:hypothetical protein ACFVT1_36300 [Streptomyces sp. NPDC057963]|uniref:hypothetical protein n=1 Tax=Streptomyces sp. NPDC057963 TaxID=3346290 RepID=UPI0036E12E53
MTGTSGSLSPASALPVYGRVWATGNLDLVAPASGAWLPVPGCQITLPEAGTYEVTAESDGAINLLGVSGQGVVINIRLYDATAGAVVPNGARLLVANSNAASAAAIANGAHATHDYEVAVTGPTTLRMEAQRVTGGGAPISYTGVLAVGTTLAFKKLGTL